MLFFLLAACRPPARALQPLPLDGRWKTLKAEQRVTIDAVRANGKREHHTLRAVIAVERPDRFRLRALGPGGITLFDLVGHAGKVAVIEAIRDPAGPSLRPILESLAGDVETTYGLGQKSTNVRSFLENGARVVDDGERRVVIGPRRIEIENRARGYRVVIELSSQELDVPLDPELFADAPP